VRAGCAFLRVVASNCLSFFDVVNGVPIPNANRERFTPKMVTSSGLAASEPRTRASMACALLRVTAAEVPTFLGRGPGGGPGFFPPLVRPPTLNEAPTFFLDFETVPVAPKTADRQPLQLS